MITLEESNKTFQARWSLAFANRFNSIKVLAAGCMLEERPYRLGDIVYLMDHYAPGKVVHIIHHDDIKPSLTLYMVKAPFITPLMTYTAHWLRPCPAEYEVTDEES